jgi:hypothetical protein
VKKKWFELSIEEWNVKRTDDGRQEQSRKKQKEQQQSPATDSWTVDFMTRQGERQGMYSQVVEVLEHIVEEEKTTATGIDRHVPVWALVEQDWSTERQGMRALWLGNGKQGAGQAGLKLSRWVIYKAHAVKGKPR